MSTGDPGASVRTFENIKPGPACPGLPGSHAETGFSEYEFRLLRDYIHDYCGIYFDESKAYTLSSRLAFRLRLLDISSYSEYYNYLKYNPRSKEEMEHLIPHLTNNETYFFREMEQINLFAGVLLKETLNKKRATGDRSIRIISCGCSSGEEALTLAMVLEESGLYAQGWDISITGVDIDRKVLEKASSGEYTSYSLRATEKERIERYFKKDGDKYVLDGRIRQKVTFVRGNITDLLALSEQKGADAIFCRNVLIYFSDPAIKKTAENFYETLSEGGHLMLGHSESLSRITDIFSTRRFPGTIVYQKLGR